MSREYDTIKFDGNTYDCECEIHGSPPEISDLSVFIVSHSSSSDDIQIHNTGVVNEVYHIICEKLNLPNQREIDRKDDPWPRS